MARGFQLGVPLSAQLAQVSTAGAAAPAEIWLHHQLPSPSKMCDPSKVGLPSLYFCSLSKRHDTICAKPLLSSLLLEAAPPSCNVSSRASSCTPSLGPPEHCLGWQVEAGQFECLQAAKRAWDPGCPHPVPCRLPRSYSGTLIQPAL